MAIEIVDLPIYIMVDLSIVMLPEGKCEKKTLKKKVGHLWSFSIKRMLENIKFAGFKNGDMFGPHMIIHGFAVTTLKVFKDSFHGPCSLRGWSPCPSF